MAQKADIVELATWLGGGMADPITLGEHVDDALQTQSRTQTWCMEASTIPVTAGVGVYAKQEQMVNVIAAFYDDRQLFNEESQAALDALNPYWRTEVGTPIGYVMDNTIQDEIAIYPAPDKTTSTDMPIDMPFPAPGNLMFVHTQAGPDVPEYATLPLACMALIGEFTHDSPHKDTDFASTSAMLWKLLSAVYA